MNIALLGYGKMGKLIGQLAEERGHHIVAKIDLENQALRDSLDPKTIDVAIEFSQPEAALENIRWAITHGIPVLSGTTGWLDRLSEIDDGVEIAPGGRAAGGPGQEPGGIDLAVCDRALVLHPAQHVGIHPCRVARLLYPSPDAAIVERQERLGEAVVLVNNAV
jgi:hypothetical protein